MGPYRHKATYLRRLVLTSAALVLFLIWCKFHICVVSRFPEG